MAKITIEKIKHIYSTVWLITMYKKDNWWTPARPIAQWRTNSKKTILKKATELLEQFHKLEMEIL